ncbi:hypothetical protein P872_20860 [Rhodonellum psychrophilum GCM71 = DSM 17998]|uniref:Uncharacterized protein n=2 Tax=Rhodonellum TaxID=336827 RepID=U5BYX5_9BACT|nr:MULTISPECIES: hypothetical protein [Rhodonellum]ERM81117.1 hypothetical protein P872_20860 [Rhodonellum psychrophilum GCM71 = DSM 17998]SDZ51618.1 hypothetical protein SAMN05444412_11946 [Rhodonellum ikkaensis]
MNLIKEYAPFLALLILISALYAINGVKPNVGHNNMKSMEDRIIELKKRLDESKIVYEEIVPENPEFPNRIIFDIPAGREKNDCFLVFREEPLEQALGCEFEKFRFIQGYEGIWSKEKGIIEAEISSVESPSRFFFNRLNELINKPEKEDDDEENEEITSITLPTFDNFVISMGYCSHEFAFLSSCRERGPRGRSLRRITLKIENSKAATHDAAREILDKIANSIFFQIDLSYEIPISLQSQRESWIERHNRRRRKQLFVDETAKISEPKYEYDSEPISLYWYAKESGQMPIFQYLAFYQTVEFYFPIYSSFEAKQKIQGIIKDPRFNPNRDTDITKIISTIQSNVGGKSFGNEREQLKATINSCTNNIELKEFFTTDQKRFDFYAENKGKNLAKQKISVKNETADLIAEVSERIYEIRCRIVHSKASEGDFEVLLPYSNEVKKMDYDIELIEFIARKVLITSSRPIKI